MKSRQKKYYQVKLGQVDGKEVLYLHNSNFVNAKCLVKRQEVTLLASQKYPRLYYRNGDLFIKSDLQVFQGKENKSAYYMLSDNGNFCRLYLSRRSCDPYVLVYRDIEELTPIPVRFKDRVCLDNKPYGKNHFFINEKNEQIYIHTSEAHKKFQKRHTATLSSTKRERQFDVELENNKQKKVKLDRQQHNNTNRDMTFGFAPGYIDQKSNSGQSRIDQVDPLLANFGIFSDNSVRRFDPLVEPDESMLDYDWSSFDEAMGIK